MIFDLGVQGIVWVRRSMKNGGKDFPDRWDSRNRSIEVKWTTARSGTERELRLGRSLYVYITITNAMKTRLFSLAG